MYILFFVISFIFALQTNVLHHNFTYFSYTEPYVILYYIWFLTLGITLYIKLWKITSQVDSKNKILCHFAFLSYLCGGILPYTTNTQNLTSTFHVIFSLLAILLVLYILYQDTQAIKYIHDISYQKIMHSSQIGIASIFPIWMINGTINCLIELYGLAYILYILYQLEKPINKTNK